MFVSGHVCMTWGGLPGQVCWSASTIQLMHFETGGNCLGIEKLASMLQDYLVSKYFRVTVQLGAGDAGHAASVPRVCTANFPLCTCHCSAVRCAVATVLHEGLQSGVFVRMLGISALVTVEKLTG